MAGLPLTRIQASASHAAAIRDAVRTVTSLGTQPGAARLARLEDAPALFGFLCDPAVHAPIYTLPRPLTEDSVRDFIARHLDERRRGDGLLFVTPDEAGRIVGYSDLQIWPDWAAGELGGALHPDRQGRGEGISGAAASFSWMFETLGLDLLCETAAPENIRTAKLLDHLGFERKGEVISTRSDGTTRPSLVWEIDRASWMARHS